MKLHGTILKKQQHINQQTDKYIGYRLIEKRDQNEFKQLFKNVQQCTQGTNVYRKGEDGTFKTESMPKGVFYMTLDGVKPICEYIHDTTLATIFGPIEKQLKLIKPSEFPMNTSSDGDLPDYSFAPQEFITQV